MFLKNTNIIFKIRRSKVTDYAALKSLQNGYFPIFILFLQPILVTIATLKIESITDFYTGAIVLIN